MILIADSGSTKTEWVVTEGHNVLQTFKTVGLNPYFVKTEEARGILQEAFAGQFNKKDIHAVYFYGAGCSSAPKQKVIHDALQDIFPRINTLVDHDMLAAARALFGNTPGVACILGTGSNACVYDGRHITESLFSLGYMFGDEGSGAHLGKSYISDHLKEKAPMEIMTAFVEKYELSREEILTHIYKKANPNRFLASFTHFLKEHLDHPYIFRLAEECFEAFFEEQVSRFFQYQKRKLGCIGSVAYHFREVFERAAGKYGMQAAKIVVSPMEGLVGYHASNPS